MRRATVPLIVKGQGGQKASFKFQAVDPGTYVVQLSGDPGDVDHGGATVDYILSIGVKRAKTPTMTFNIGVGGVISVPFSAPAGSTVTLSAKTKKGGFDLAELVGPAGAPEPGFQLDLGSLSTRDCRRRVA